MKSCTRVKNIFWAAATIMLMLITGSCARKTTFLTSSVVPAAEGSVKVKKDKNNNYQIEIKLSNLAEPKRLQPPRELYIVWMLTDDNSTKNIGQIKTSAGFLSHQLKASFQTVSSFKPVKIFITADDDANIQYPHSEAVLTTGNF